MEHVSVSVGAIYLVLSIAFSMFFGLCAERIFLEATEQRPIRIFYQFWFNFLGSAFGWGAGWFLLRAAVGCNGGQCETFLSGSSLVLVVLAFVGMTGHLPLATMTAIAAMTAAVKELANLTTKALKRSDGQ